MKWSILAIEMRHGMILTWFICSDKQEACLTLLAAKNNIKLKIYMIYLIDKAFFITIPALGLSIK